MRITGISIACFMVLVLGTGSGCRDSAGKTNEEYSTQKTNPADSLEKIKISKELEQLNRQVELEGQRYKLAYPVLNANDSIDYFILFGKPARISMNMNNGEGTIWPTYFLKDGELIHVRYRTLVKDSTAHYAQEIMAYLRQGKIFYIEERQMDLQPNEIPALLRLRPYTVSKRPFGEFENVYMEYWPKLKQAVDLHYLSVAPGN